MSENPGPPEFTDPASGRRYMVDHATGQSRWVDEQPPPPPPPTAPSEPQVYTDGATGLRYTVNATGQTEWVQEPGWTPPPPVAAQTWSHPAAPPRRGRSGVNPVVLVAIAVPIVAALIGGIVIVSVAAKHSGSGSGTTGAVASVSPTCLQLNGKCVDTTVPTASDAPSTSSVAKIGDVGFTYTDGLEVNVTSAKRFTISQYAAGGQRGDVGVVVTVTIKNGSSAPVDMVLTRVNLSAGPNGVQADRVFDTENGLGHGFEGKIAPGGKATAKFGFAVPKADLGAITVEVEPAFGYDSCLFSGTV